MNINEVCRIAASDSVVVIHDNDADGFGGAWALWKRLGNRVRYIPGDRGKLPEDLGRPAVVVMVDLTYEETLMHDLLEVAGAVVVLDHHVTALNLKSLDDPRLDLSAIDTNRSAAAIAWMWAHGEPVPDLIAYIEDWDLWRKTLPDVAAFTTAIYATEMSFEAWDALTVERLIADGKVMRRHFESQIAVIVEKAMTVEIAGCRVPLVNCPRMFSSEVLNRLSVDHPFAVAFRVENGRFFLSLRSKADGADVSEVAGSLASGGGGHRNAAGCELPLAEGFALIQTGLDQADAAA